MLWSTPQRITSKNYFTEIIGQNYAGLYYLQTSKNVRDQNVMIIALTHSLKTKSKEIFINNSKEHLVKALLLNNSLLLFYTIINKKENKTELFVKQLDPDLNSIVEDKRIATIASHNYHKDFFRIIPNRKRDQILITTPNNIDSLHNNLTVSIYNQNCVKEKNTTLSFSTSKKDQILSFSQLIDGYYFGIISHQEKEGMFKKELHRSLFAHNIESGETQIIPLYSSEFNIRAGNFTYDNLVKELSYNSYYYNTDSLKPIGFYQLNYALNTDSVKTSKIPFPQVMLDELFGMDRRNPKVEMLYLMKTVKRNDGGTIFISEKKEVDEQVLNDVSVYGIQQNYVRYYYYYYEISLLSINPDGSTDWHKTINKEQVSLNDEGYYSSFGCEVVKDRIYFIYNDLTRKSSNVILYAVKPDGSSTNDLLIKGKEFDGYAIPKESIQLSSNELLVPLIKTKEGFTLMKMIF